MDTYEATFLYFLACFISSFAKQPNIILILTDDQGYGDVNAHGHPYLKTPNMNKLRAEGVSFITSMLAHPVHQLGQLSLQECMNFAME